MESLMRKYPEQFLPFDCPFYGNFIKRENTLLSQLYERYNDFYSQYLFYKNGLDNPDEDMPDGQEAFVNI